MSGGDEQQWKREYERLALLYQVSNVIHSTLDAQEALWIRAKARLGDGLPA